MKARLLSNVTMQPIAAALQPLDVTIGDYGSLILELVDARSPAAGDDVSHVLCLFDTDTLLGDAFYQPAADTEARVFVDALDTFCAAHPGKTVVTNTFCAGTNRPATFTEPIADRSVSVLEQELNGRLRDIARERANLVLIDLGLVFRRYGEERLTNASFWYSGRIRYTSFMFRVLAAEITQALAAYGGRAKKVLVLDLDNTLWGGIVGETGPLGVTLSEQGEGAIFRDFQRAVKALKSTGVLLAVCSKNNPEDVDELFEQNSMMLLAREDFVCIRANWDAKPKNLADIAHTLNLGLESFVFIDDNPVERQIVAASMPEISVPEFPARIEDLPRWFIDDVVRPYFGKYRITSEELAKTEQYRANESRRDFAVNLDLDAFLDALQIECDIKVDSPDTVVRASQMTQKTNQFNLTTRRCEIPEIARYVESPDNALITLAYKDRFGSEGIVALAMVDRKRARIDNIVMSCRVIGRKVEDRLLEKVIDVLRDSGAQLATAEYIPTRKNQQVASFYEEHGFELIGEGADGTRQYQRAIR